MFDNDDSEPIVWSDEVQAAYEAGVISERVKDDYIAGYITADEALTGKTLGSDNEQED